MSLFNENQKQLRDMILKPDLFESAIKLCLEQHAFVHCSEVSGLNEPTLEDQIWNNLDVDIFRIVKKGHKSIAYHLWHCTRIEDITINLLVAGERQVFNVDWMHKIGSSIKDTGNAMDEEQIQTFSQTINPTQLRAYRIAVGRKTREILSNLKASDMKRKMDKKRLQTVLDEGAVLNVEGANWLIDFWEKKNVAGIILMPITRHHLVHLHEAMKIKKK